MKTITVSGPEARVVESKGSFLVYASGQLVSYIDVGVVKMVAVVPE